MPSVVVLILDVLIALLLISIANIFFLNAPIWIIAIPLVFLGIMFLIWLIRKISDMRD